MSAWASLRTAVFCGFHAVRELPGGTALNRLQTRQYRLGAPEMRHECALHPRLRAPPGNPHFFLDNKSTNMK